MEKRNEKGQTLQEFLKAYNPKDFVRPSVTVDMLLFATDEKRERLKILLVKRKDHPFIGEWAFPGGFINIDESAYEAACRELEEETGLKGIYMEQLYTFTNPKRDPRMRVIDIAYMALVPMMPVKAGDDAKEAAWFDVTATKEEILLSHEDVTIRYKLEEKQFHNGKVSVNGIVPAPETETKLAFDHAEILLEGITRLRNKMLYTDIIFNLMPDKFSILDIRDLYRVIMNEDIHPQKVRRMFGRYIEKTQETKDDKLGRPELLYQVKNQAMIKGGDKDE